MIGFAIAALILTSVMIPLGIIFGLIKWRAYQANRLGIRHPISTDLLRPAGHSLSLELDDARFDMVFSMTSALMVSVIAVVVLVGASELTLFGPTMAVTMAILTWLGGMYFVVRDLLRAIQRVRNLRLGWEGEVATAEELNRLMLRGFHVFHDVPAEGFNIDHVIVGATGVFAVETKCRVKRRGGDNKDHVVRYDGQQLHFPNYVDTKPIEQAKRQAVWLSKWLTGNVGEPVKAEPAVAIPGWYVEITGRGDVIVMTPKQAAQAFGRSRSGQNVDPTVVNRVVYALDKQCRSVKPRANFL